MNTEPDKESAEYQLLLGLARQFERTKTITKQIAISHYGQEEYAAIVDEIFRSIMAHFWALTPEELRKENEEHQRTVNQAKELHNDN